jgi:hypothetical protein
MMVSLLFFPVFFEHAWLYARVIARHDADASRRAPDALTHVCALHRRDDHRHFAYVPNIPLARQTFAIRFEYAGLKTPDPTI